MLPVRLQFIPWIARLNAPETGVPYGAAMVLAALILFPLTPLQDVEKCFVSLSSSCIDHRRCGGMAC